MGDPASASPPEPFRLIQQRIAELHWRWRTWKQLFVADEKRKYGLMRRATPMAFAVIQQALFDDVVLRVCKLVERPRGGSPRQRRENLVLERFIIEAEQRGDQRAADAREKLGELGGCAKQLQRLRNRCIAHEDFETATSPQLPDAVEYRTVDRAIQLAIETAQQLEDDESPYGYEWLIAPGDGEALLEALRRAEQGRSWRRTIAYLEGISEGDRRLENLPAKSPAGLDALLPSILDKAFKGEL